MVYFSMNMITGHFLWDTKISSIPEEKTYNLNVIQNCGKHMVSQYRTPETDG